MQIELIGALDYKKVEELLNSNNIEERKKIRNIK